MPLSGLSDGRRRRRRHFTYAAAAVVLVSAILWSIHDWAHGGAVVNEATLGVATVTRGRFVREISAEGNIAAAVMPTLFAVARGTVSYRVHAGDVVKKGQVLATLDSPDLTNDYQRERDALAALDVALRRLRIQSRLQLLANERDEALMQLASREAEQELSRQKAAWALRVVPEREYREAVYAAKAAELDAAHAVAAAPLEREDIALELTAKSIERDREALLVEQLERQVGQLTVRSPVDGMVGNLAQADRAEIGKNAPIVTVVDLGRFDVEFQVPETYAAGLRPGVAGEVEVDGAEYPGRVTSISPEVRDYEVSGRLAFLSPLSGGLRQGERVLVRLELDDIPNVLKLERGPGIDENTAAVYVIRNNRAVRTPVVLGAVSTSEVEVLRGLSAGDRVVISDTRRFGGAAEIDLSQ